MTAAAVIEAGATDAELDVMRRAAARVAAQSAEPHGEDPFTALAQPFFPLAPGTRARAGYPRCCNGAHHFCVVRSDDA